MVFPLMMTSLTFLVPAIFASYRNLYIHSRFLFLTSLASTNYWRHPVPGWRHKIDVIVARSCFVYFFVQGVTRVKDPVLQIIGYPTIALSLYCYRKAYYLNNNNNIMYIPYHMVFHLTTITVQCIVISGLK
jgi:hypothetical protein